MEVWVQGRGIGGHGLVRLCDARVRASALRSRRADCVCGWRGCARVQRRSRRLPSLRRAVGVRRGRRGAPWVCTLLL